MMDYLVLLLIACSSIFYTKGGIETFYATIVHVLYIYIKMCRMCTDLQCNCIMSRDTCFVKIEYGQFIIMISAHF